MDIWSPATVKAAEGKKTEKQEYKLRKRYYKWLVENTRIQAVTKENKSCQQWKQEQIQYKLSAENTNKQIVSREYQNTGCHQEIQKTICLRIQEYKLSAKNTRILAVSREY